MTLAQGHLDNDTLNAKNIRDDLVAYRPAVE